MQADVPVKKEMALWHNQLVWSDFRATNALGESRRDVAKQTLNRLLQMCSKQDQPAAVSKLELISLHDKSRATMRMLRILNNQAGHVSMALEVRHLSPAAMRLLRLRRVKTLLSGVSRAIQNLLDKQL